MRDAVLIYLNAKKYFTLCSSRTKKKSPNTHQTPQQISGFPGMLHRITTNMIKIGDKYLLSHEHFRSNQQQHNPLFTFVII